MSCTIKINSKEVVKMNAYESLMEYYKECFELVDCFHFNSEGSKGVYTTRIPDINGMVIPISHCGI